MIRRQRLILIALIVVGAVLALSLALFVPPGSYKNHYKLVLEVEANGQVHRGSSVLEYATRALPPNLAQQTLTSKARGEATLVDLGDGRALVALLGDANTMFGRTPFPQQELWAPYIPLSHGLGLDPRWSNKRNPALERLRWMRSSQPVDVRPDDLPAFVLLTDTRNPRSIVPADPRHLDAALGGNARLKRATIELTSERLTSSIEEHLPWLKNRRELGGDLDNGTLTIGANGEYDVVSSALFIRGELQ